MAKKEIRFCITDDQGHRAASWKLWTQDGIHGPELYLVCRELGGILHTSFHPSGEWHTTMTREAKKSLGHDPSLGPLPKYVEEWGRPPEVKPSVTLAYKILTPSGSANAKCHGNKRKLSRIPEAPIGRANETMILIIRAGVDLCVDGDNFFWKADLSNGETVVLVNHVIEMPKPPPPVQGGVRYCKRMSKADLSGDGVRAIIFTHDQNGHKLIIDSPVKNQS